MKKLIILRGLPSSGKTFLANELYQQYYQNWAVVEIFSTDNYWIRPDGLYDWNVKLLSKAHEWNYNKFAEFTLKSARYSQNDTYIAILDNTNVVFGEFSQYIVNALAAGFEIEIQEPATAWKFDIDECYKRNSHSVPKETIQRMKNKWESTESCQQKLEILKSQK